MDPSFKVQLDIKNNAEEFQKYVMDLNNWEEEMKNKELTLGSEPVTEKDVPPPRNKVKRTKAEKDSPASSSKSDKKPKRISAYDYSSWDKFDVDKACKDVDKDDTKGAESIIQMGEKEQSEEEEEDEQEEESVESDKKLKFIDQAFYEKELGNQFVKQEKWTDAIHCYSNAIDCDPKNAVYYANRALCFLKLRNFKAAETDSTTAIQVDKKYIKAYLRRAFARTALGQLKEAKADYEEVLKLEPKNSLARVEMEKIEKNISKSEPVIPKPKVPSSSTPSFNPKSMFEKKAPPEKPKQEQVAKKSKAEVSHGKETQLNKQSKSKEKKLQAQVEKDVKLTENLVTTQGKGDVEKNSVEKQILKSSFFKSPLPEGCTQIYPIKKLPHLRSKKPLKKIEVMDISETSQTVQVQRTTPVSEVSTSEVSTSTTQIENKISEIVPVLNVERLEAPKTCIQFKNTWKRVQSDPESSYKYLQKMCGHELRKIFEDAMESDTLSDLLYGLTNEKVLKDTEMLYFFMDGLTRVKRFKSMVMFLSSRDKENVKMCLKALQEAKIDKDVNKLQLLYEL